MVWCRGEGSHGLDGALALSAFKKKKKCIITILLDILYQITILPYVNYNSTFILTNIINMPITFYSISVFHCMSHQFFFAFVFYVGFLNLNINC